MKKWIWIIISVIVVVAGVIAYNAYRNVQNQTNQISNIQMVTLENGSLISSISGTGNVRSGQNTMLLWSTSGTVEQILVDILETVKEGDVLAVLQDSSLPQSVIQAQVELYNAKVALEDLYEGYSQLVVAQAAQKVSHAEEDLADAERNYYNLSNPADQTFIDQAYASLVLAESRLETAQENYERFANRPEDNLQRASALSSLADAEQAYYAALRNYNSVTGVANDLTLSVAAADLEVVRQNLANAQVEYERILEGPSQDEIAAAEARVTAAEITLSQVWIEAPFDGTITMVIPQLGDQVTPSTQAFRLDDLSTLYIDVQISEIDIAQVEADQEVIISIDALPGKEYHGYVDEVAWVGSEAGGLVDFEVTIALIDADEDIRPGMTAAVEIVISSLEETLLVPNQAIRVEAGVQVVYTFTPGSGLSPIEVTLGASSETHSQVLEGDVEAGERIVLNPTAALDALGIGGNLEGGMFGIMRGGRGGSGSDQDFVEEIHP